MTGIIILSAVPVIVGAACYYFRKAEKPELYCLFCGIVFFLVLGFGAGADDTGRITLAYSVQTAEDVLPPGIIWLIQIISEAVVNPKGFFLITALGHSAAAALFLYVGCSRPYSGGLIFTLCFMLEAYAGTGFFTAAIILLYGFRFFIDGSFFRFAGIALLAACFDMSAVLLIPLYPVMKIPVPLLSAAAAFAIACTPLFIPGCTDMIFSVFDNTYTFSRAFPLYCAVPLTLTGIVFILSKDMFANRNERLAGLPAVFCTGAAFSLPAAFDSRFFPVSVFLLMPSSLMLSQDGFEIGKRFIEIMFPQKNRAVKTAALVIVCAVLYGLYILALFNNMYSTDGFGTVFFGNM